MPLIGVDRKWSDDGQNGANDPQRTSAKIPVYTSRFLLPTLAGAAAQEYERRDNAERLGYRQCVSTL